jgi:predicted NBD/HSP70 family sugar kinase
LSEKVGSGTDIGKLCFDILSESKTKSSDVSYMGIAADGNSNEIIAEMEKAYGIKCYSSSVISARALGEAYRANDVLDLCLLKVDDTIECGIVIDKKMYAGEKQMGGKVANMIINFGGYECSCGSRGCFEAYASNSGLKRIAADAGVADAESLTHTSLFAMTSPEAEEAKKLYVEYLASGITNIINLFQPNELVLDGPFTQVGDALWTPFMEIIMREQYTHGMPNKCTIRFASKEEDVALIGAALLGR